MTLTPTPTRFPCPKRFQRRRAPPPGGRKAAASKKSGGRKTTGETINLDTPPRKKLRSSAARYSIKKKGCYTINPYAHRLKNKIGVVLH